MAASLDFYFDFSSPYGYLASTRIDALAAKHGLEARWHPFLLGAVFKITNTIPLVDQPMKGVYTRRDMPRAARRQGVPFRLPPRFPFGTVTSCRAFYHVQRSDPQGAVVLAKALFHAAFVEGRDIAPVEAVAAVAETEGFDGAGILAGMATPEVKALLKLAVDRAIERGVFGSPFFLVGGEPFWGNDRLAEVDEWLTTGGW